MNKLTQLSIAAIATICASSAAYANFNVLVNSQSQVPGTVLSAPIVAAPKTAVYIPSANFPLTMPMPVNGQIFAINDQNNANGNSNSAPTDVDLVIKNPALNIVETIQFLEYYNGPNKPAYIDAIPTCSDEYGNPTGCLFVTSCASTQGDLLLTYVGVPTQDQGASCNLSGLSHKQG